MHRADELAILIYERARAWTRASFFYVQLTPNRTSPIVFENGTTITGPLANRALLFCDIEPGERWPHRAALFTWSGYGDELVVDGWVDLVTPINENASYIHMLDRTRDLQIQLNRFRLREETMTFGLSRQPERVAPLFKPDHEVIAKHAGVPASTVRNFFDGKNIPIVFRDKILLTLGMRPEEMKAALWVP